MAISAVDSALWDLKANSLNIPLASLLGSAQPSVEVYGSGGFTSYSIEKLQKQLSGWVEKGIKAVKMKISRHLDKDVARVKAARKAIGHYWCRKRRKKWREPGLRTPWKHLFRKRWNTCGSWARRSACGLFVDANGAYSRKLALAIPKDSRNWE